MQSTPDPDSRRDLIEIDSRVYRLRDIQADLSRVHDVKGLSDDDLINLAHVYAEAERICKEIARDLEVAQVQDIPTLPNFYPHIRSSVDGYIRQRASQVEPTLVSVRPEDIAHYVSEIALEIDQFITGLENLS